MTSFRIPVVLRILIREQLAGATLETLLVLGSNDGGVLLSVVRAAGTAPRRPEEGNRAPWSRMDDVDVAPILNRPFRTSVDDRPTRRLSHGSASSLWRAYPVLARPKHRKAPSETT
jgi:hypothetical protein